MTESESMGPERLVEAILTNPRDDETVRAYGAMNADPGLRSAFAAYATQLPPDRNSALYRNIGLTELASEGIVP